MHADSFNCLYKIEELVSFATSNDVAMTSYHLIT